MEATLIRTRLRLERMAEAFAPLLARGNRWLLVGFSVVFFLGSTLIAAEKLYWFDELYTYHLAKLTIPELWAALVAGVDLNPPLNYLLTRGSHGLFGDNAVATRLPPLVGFWVLLLCLYHFVARRCGRLWGWVALLIPLATWAYPYAYEARPYGVILGCCGLALVCWQSAADNVRRGWMLSGLALSLAVATAAHYYAVLLLGPLLLGELVRTVSRRRLDGFMLLAFAAGLLPILALLPQIRQGASYAATHSETVRWSFAHDFYHELLGRSLLPLVVLLVVACFLLYGTRRPYTPHREEDRTGLRGYEIALILGLLALPLVGTVVAKMGGGAFGLRYVLSAVAGVALLCAAVAHRLAGGTRLFGGAAVVVLLGWFVAIVAGDYLRVRAEAAALRNDYVFLERQGPTEMPIVIPGPITYLQFIHYAPARLAPRLVYVKEARLEESYFTQRRYSVEGAMLALHRWKPMNIVDSPPRTNQGRAYYVYSPGRLTEQLESTAARLELRGRNGRNLLFFTADRPGEDREIVRIMPRLVD